MSWTRDVDIQGNIQPPPRQPYLNIPGSEGATFEGLQESAKEAYGDGSMASPVAPGTQVTAEEYLSWHSEQQKAYVLDNRTGENELAIGVGDDIINVVMSDDGEHVYVLDFLQKSDFARMPIEDQKIIAETETWLYTISLALDMQPTAAQTQDYLLTYTTIVNLLRENLDDPLGYAVEAFGGTYYDGTETFDSQPFIDQLDVLDEMVYGQAVFSPTDIEATITGIQNRFERALAFFDVKTVPLNPTNSKSMGALYDADYYADRRGLMMDLLDDDDFHDEVDKYAVIETNDDDGELFVVYDEEDFASAQERQEFAATLGFDDFFTTNSYLQDVISLDNNVTINNGYQLFIEQERRLAAWQKQKLELAKYGVFGGKTLDGAMLVATFQTMTSEIVDALLTMQTEEVEQQNRLLQDTALFQEQINYTLSLFDPSKADSQKLGFGGGDEGSRDTAQWSMEQVRAIAMFTSGLAGQPHPLEKLQKLERPLFEIISQPTAVDQHYTGDYVNGFYSFEIVYPDTTDAAQEWEFITYFKTAFDTWATSVTDYITTLNQNAQVSTNESNSLTKQKAAHFDAAVNMFGVLQKLASSLIF
jgi:hypothetical protein